MSRREERQQAVRPGQGKTVTAQAEKQEPQARLPHEHDESADSQAQENPSARRIGTIAHHDVERGRQDTSKAEELDATYHRLRQEKEKDSAPEPQEKADRERRG